MTTVATSIGTTPALDDPETLTAILTSASTMDVDPTEASAASAPTGAGPVTEPSFLLEMEGAAANVKPRLSLSSTEVDVISRLHAAGHHEDSQHFDDAKLLESSAALARKTRTMLEMISAIDQIGLSAVRRGFGSNTYEVVLDEWRKAYVPQVKATHGPKTFAAEFCGWLREDSEMTEGHKDVSHLDSYISTLTKMSKAGGIMSYRKLRKDTKEQREAYLLDRSSEAPELIMWGTHAEYADDIRAHMEGLRRTYVSILSDFRTLAEKRPMSAAASAMLSKPWDDIEQRTEISNRFGEAKYREEEARTLNVPLNMLERPTVKDTDSPWDAPEASTQLA